MLEWGFAPEGCIQRLRSCELASQQEALDDIDQAVRSAEVSIVVSHLHSLLTRLSPLIKCDVVGVATAAMGTLSTVISVAKGKVSCIYDILVDTLLSVLDNTHSAIRQSAVQCLALLTKVLRTPQRPSLQIVKHIVPKVSQNHDMHTREEVVNFIMFCLLSDRHAVDLSLAKFIYPLLYQCLIDPRPRVEFVAVEAFAVLRNILGDVIDREIAHLKLNGHEEIFDLLMERFSDPMLPSHGDNGFVIHPMLRDAFSSKEGGDHVYVAKDMQLAHVSEEDKIKLWLPTQELTPISRIKPVCGGDLEIVSISSAASSKPVCTPLCRELVSQSSYSGILDSAGSSSSTSDKLSLLRASKSRGKRRLLGSNGTSCTTPGSSVGPSPTCTSFTETSYTHTPSTSAGTTVVAGRKRMSGAATSPAAEGVVATPDVNNIPSSVLPKHVNYSDVDLPHPLPQKPIKRQQQPLKQSSLKMLKKRPPNGALVGNSISGSTGQGSILKLNPRTENADALLLTVTSQDAAYKGLLETNARPAQEVETADLKPVKNPERSLGIALQQIRDGDWRTHFDALNTIRAVVVHHDSAVAPQLQTVLATLVSSSENLRSAVAKTAVVAVGNVIETLKRCCDPYLESVISQLIKKTHDSNHFLVEQAEKSIQLSIIHCTSSRVLCSLINCAGHKAERQRAKVTKHLHGICIKMGSAVFASRDLGKLLATLSKFLGEGSFEIRHWAKQCLYTISTFSLNDSEFERTCVKTGLSTKQVDKTLEVIKKVRIQNEANRESNVSRVTLTPGEICQQTTSLRKKSSDLGQVQSNSQTAPQTDVLESTCTDPLSGTIASTGSSSSLNTIRHCVGRRISSIQYPESLGFLSSVGDGDWKLRLTGLQKLLGIVRSPEMSHDLREERSVNLVIDCLLSRCLDQNQKVIILSLQILGEFLLVVGSIPIIALARVLSVVVTPLASSSSVIVKEAQTTLDAIREVEDCVQFVVHVTQQLTNCSHHRVKVNLLSQLYSAVELAHGEDPTCVAKYVIPASLRFLADPRSDVRLENNKVLTRCHDLIGDAIYEQSSSLPPLQAQRLSDLLED